MLMAAVVWTAVLVCGIVKLYTSWQNSYRTPSEPIYPTELVYKTIEDRNIRMDVYRPNDTLTAHKTILYIHGGSWICGTKRKVQDFYRYYVIKTMLNNHIEVISLDYSLIARHANTLENCIYDCRDAMHYCIENSHYLKIDTAHIGLWGSSAGAHVAMMSFVQERENEHIKCIIDDFGPTDITEMWSKVPDFLRRLACTIFFHMRYRDLKKFEVLTKAFSPLHHTDKLCHVPILISHGDHDKVVNYRQSVWLHDALPNTTDIYIYPGLEHGFETMDSTQIQHYTDRVMNFVEKHLN